VKVTKVPWVYTYVEKVGSNLDIDFACSCVFQDLGAWGTPWGLGGVWVWGHQNHAIGQYLNIISTRTSI